MPRRPDPPPVPTNDLRVVAVCTAFWLVGLVVAVAFRARWIPTCACGFGLGLAGLAYTRRRR